MNRWKIAKMVIALLFIIGWVSIAFASTVFVALIPALPIIGPLIGITIAPVWIALGVFALPVSIAVSLKLLSYIDAGMGELGANLHLRTQFVKARAKLTRYLPGMLEKAVNLLT